MKITSSTINKILLTEVDRLDPITVYLEDYEPGKGKIVIECYGKAWSSYWGSMSVDNTIATFFCSCDEHYIAKNLSSIDSEIVDFNAISKAIGEDVDLTSLLFFSRKLEEVYGPDWRFGLPQKSNPDYLYLCRIIKAVQAALKEIQA